MTCRDINVLGVRVSAIDMPTATRTIDRWIRERTRTYVTVTGVHGVIESQRDEGLRAIHNRAGLVTPDGMPLVWISRMHGVRSAARVYGPDLMLALCGKSDGGSYRHFFYGGAAGVPDLLKRRLLERFPRLNVVGTHSPPFRDVSAEEDEGIVKLINDADADILWVGLSTPKQERWMASHLGRVTAPVMIGVGAAFDFHSGLKRQAPRWMRSSGLEWSFRLACEPRRLARRYLVNNPVFLYLLALQTLGLRRFELSGPGDPERLRSAAS